MDRIADGCRQNLISFFNLVPEGLPPGPASKSAKGTLPVDGYRYCEPLRAASSFGWYVYLPYEIWLFWDGSETQWSLDEGQSWYPLAEAIQYPGFADEFNSMAPEDCRGYAPPFLGCGADHDILQIWTGVIATTEPEMCLLVRGPSNMAWRTDIAVLEGVIETDHWFGPLFTNVKLRKPDTPIILRKTQPFLQVQPIPRAVITNSSKTNSAQVLEGLGAMHSDDWARYKDTVVRRMETRKNLGDYAVEVRKGRRS